MRHALSTFLFVEQRLTVALLDRVLRSGITEIELFCGRQHFDYRDRAQLNELRHWFRDTELKVHSIHSPMFSDDIWGRSGPQALVSITQLSKAKRIASTDEIKRAIEVAEIIPFRYAIQHIGVSGEEWEEEKVEAVFNCLDELIVFARQRGVDLLVENIPNAFSTADRLKMLLDTTHLPIGFCFDTGHANLATGVEREFGIMKDRIRSTHVHDNNGSDDIHLFPLNSEGGTIDWAKTMELMRSIEDKAPLVLELAATGDMEKPLDEARRSFERLENR
jgi:sugar phosphate isomerase/epimerase